MSAARQSTYKGVPYVECSRERPCPICGHDNWCKRAIEEGDDDRAALCMRSSGGTSPAPGWKPNTRRDGSVVVGSSGGVVYRRVGADRPLPFSRADQEKADAIEAASRKLQVSGARWVWNKAAPSDENPDGPAWAAGYLADRGVPVETLPGGVLPRSIRGLSRCPTSKVQMVEEGSLRWKGSWRPALVAAVVDSQDRLHGLQRIFLERRPDGSVGKCSEMEKCKLALGSFASRDGACRLASDYSSGLLVLCEGIETGLALVAAGFGAVWACVSTAGMQAVGLLPQILQEAGGPLRTVVFAADFDRPDPRRGNVRPGSHAAEQGAARLKWTHPHLRIGVVWPGPDDCPSLIDAAGELIGGTKTADWLDAYNERGAGQVRASIERAAAAAVPRLVGEPVSSGGGAGGGGGDDPIDGDGGEDDETRGKRYLSKVPLERARRMLAERYGSTARERWKIAFWQEDWFYYRGGIWVLAKPAQIRATFRAWLSQFYSKVRRGTPEVLAATGQTVEDTLDAARGDCGVFADSIPAWTHPTFDDQGLPVWNDDPLAERPDASEPMPADDVINCRSGLLDADAWCKDELRVLPHTPRWFSTQQAPYELPTEALRAELKAGTDGEELCGKLCPDWLNFVGGVFESEPVSIDIMQMWFGYCLTPDISHESILMVPGPRRTGKGTMFKIFLHVIGPKSVASMSLTRLGGNFSGAGLFGRSVMMDHDCKIGKWTDPVTVGERLQKISSGDSMELERKNKDIETDWQPRMKVMVACNEVPRLPDTSGALHSRFLVVPTFKSYAGKEDRGLKQRLMKELPGIFVWALFGLRKLRKAGRFPITAAGAKWAADFRRLNAQVIAFAEDCLVEQQGSAVETSLLRRIYLGWARQHGTGELSGEQLGANLKAALAGVEREQVRHLGQRPYVYRGIRPRLEGEQAEAPAKPCIVMDPGGMDDLGFELPVE